jgi:protoporphyrinogen oxidase
MVDYVVAGGGFRGILAAALLRKKGFTIALIDAAPHLGGVLFGGKWKQFSLDLGCHLFDNTHPEHTTLLMEIFGDIIEPICVTYAGRTAGYWHDNFTVPSLAQGPIPHAELVFDLLQAHAGRQALPIQKLPTQTPPVANYQQYLIARFGKSAAKLLVSACEKKVQYSAELLDPIAARVVLFDRVNLVDHALSQFLKKIPELDAVLATQATEDPMQFYPEAKKIYPHRNFYPRGGTNQFCVRAHHYLAEQGVDIYLSQQITHCADNTVYLESGLSIPCQKVFWTLELERAEKLMLGSSTLSQSIHTTPMVVVYFEVRHQDIADYTYLHDHSEDTAIFRASSIGKYSKQNVDGHSYICCEIPTTVESPYWKEPNTFIEQFWQEAKLLKIVDANAGYFDYKIIKAPSVFKLPKIGFSAAEQRIRSALHDYTDLILTDSSYFSTQDIANVIHHELQGA